MGKKILHTKVLQISTAKETKVQWKEYDGLWGQTDLGSNPSPTYQLCVLGKVTKTAFLLSYLPVKCHFCKDLETKTQFSAWHIVGTR